MFQSRLPPVSPQSIRLVSQYQDWLKIMEAIQGASDRIQTWTLSLPAFLQDQLLTTCGDQVIEYTTTNALVSIFDNNVFLFPLILSHLYSIFCCYFVDVLILLLFLLLSSLSVSPIVLTQPWPVLYPSPFLYYTFYIFLLSVSATLLHLIVQQVYQTNMSHKSRCTGYLQCKHRLLGRDG